MIKPKLVDIVITPPVKPVKKIINTQVNINYISLFFNIICILFLCVGGYVLYIRKENKEGNQKKYIQNVNKLYDTIYNKI
jgi:hypothetical protein